MKIMDGPHAKKVKTDRITGIARDITARKKAEQELQKSEANLRTIFDTTDTIYILLDTSFRIISYNQRAVDFALNELNHRIRMSEYLLDYFPPEKQKILLSHMTDRLAGRTVNYEVSYPQPDKSENWYHVRMFPILKAHTDIYGIVFAVSNITEKKLLEKELVSRKVQEQKNIVKAVLRAQEIERNKMAQELHDNVNQILASVRMYIDTVEKEPDQQKNLIPKAMEHIDLAISEIRRLCKKQVMTQKILDLKELIDDLLSDMNAHTEIKY